MTSRPTTVPVPRPPARPPGPVDGLAVEVTGLTKAYGGRIAVDQLDLRLPAGSVTGFVGPNGAGKTTTIRMLLGLATPTGGRGHVLGVPLDQPAGYLPAVGALVEGPAFYPGLSGRDNLRVLARLAGTPDARIDQVLDTVDLRARARDRVSGYSLGMRQRLGIAAALLPRPQLLILDEPTNGLDPAGIREIRTLLTTLAGAGTTVLVSSHLLGELETVADHLILLVGGRLRFAGTTAELLSAQAGGVLARTADPADLDAVAAVAARLGVGSQFRDGGVLLHADERLAAEVNRAAVLAGITVVELSPRRADLEQAFFDAVETAVPATARDAVSAA